MQDKQFRYNPMEKKSSSEPEIDYSPKTYSLQESILFGVKMTAVAGAIIALIWIAEKYL